MPARAAESRTLAARLPVALYDALTADAERQATSLNRALVTAVRAGLAETAPPADDDGRRFIVRRLAGPTDGLLPYVVIDRTYQFGTSSFGTLDEARRIADEWNHSYPQTPEPRPALVS